MKEKVRFGNLSDGSYFEWSGRSFIKTSSRTAETRSGTCSSFVFETKDLVFIEKINEVVDDCGGLVLPGVGTNSSGGYLGADPDDLMDAYIYDKSLQDKCN